MGPGVPGAASPGTFEGPKWTGRPFAERTTGSTPGAADRAGTGPFGRGLAAETADDGRSERNGRRQRAVGPVAPLLIRRHALPCHARKKAQQVLKMKGSFLLYKFWSRWESITFSRILGYPPRSPLGTFMNQAIRTLKPRSKILGRKTLSPQNPKPSKPQALETLSPQNPKPSSPLGFTFEIPSPRNTKPLKWFYPKFSKPLKWLYLQNPKTSKH